MYLLMLKLNKCYVISKLESFLAYFSKNIGMIYQLTSNMINRYVTYIFKNVTNNIETYKNVEMKSEKF